MAYAIVERLPADFSRFVFRRIFAEFEIRHHAANDRDDYAQRCSTGDDVRFMFRKRFRQKLNAPAACAQNYDRKLKPFQLSLIEKVLLRVQSNTNLRFITVASTKPFDTLVPLHSLFS